MKSGEPSPLYLFRSQGFAASSDTVVSVAPQQHVVAVYGARHAARFRREMREHMDVVLRREAPDARLIVWSAEGKRPPQRRDGEG